jgi:hypothetical protein
MVYGYYIKDTVGNETFFTEGCMYCHMSTGGQHEPNCPCKDVKVADRPARIPHIRQIREKSFRELGDAWEYLANH